VESNVSIVTAFFDIGRGDWQGYYSRTNHQYFSYFSYLAQMNVEMVIYTQTEFADKITQIRNSFGYAEKTKVIILDHLFNQKTIDKIQDIMNDEYYRSLPTEPGCPEYWNPKYVYLNTCKAYFVTNAIDLGFITNEQVAWIDFGYCRDIDRLPKSRIWNYNFDDKINLFQIKGFDKRTIIDIMRTNTVYIQGCHIVGPKHAWTDFNSYVWSSFDSMFECGIIDDDQTMLLMAYRRNPDFYKINFIDTNEDGWFVIFKKFNYAE
jgi:protein YibB